MTRRIRPGVVFVCALALLALAGPAVGGDSQTLVYPADESVETTHGETVELTVVVSSDGGYNNTGLDSLTVVTEYDTEYLSFEGADTAGWLDGEGVEVTRETTVDREAGNVTIAESRDPPKNGVTGNQTFATLTFSVDEDAPTGATNVTFQNSTATLVGDYPIYVYDTNATVTVQESVSTPADGASSSGTDQSDDSPLMSTVAGAGVIGVGVTVMVAIAVFLRRQG